MMTSASCSIAPDSRKSELIGRLLGRCSSERLSCDSAMTGTLNSFANALSEKEGLEACYKIDGKNVSWPKGVACMGWRLPTEAEWEYAARGGQSHRFAGSNDLDAVGWFGDNSGRKTHAVCGKKKNAYGLCDMSGNVWEWVWDWYGDYPTGAVKDPKGPDSASNRGNRGGSWDGNAVYVRAAFRGRLMPSYSYSIIGARFLRSLEP